ncbi:hypothetical protein BLA24_17150 [Streptomyces cinnamoneus]|uniref:Uncharacterized protein n=1 Tax=Streptomyces cinnamoneus TaxID=53446 RepID=A0A2G1XH24_STRCJ|nr:DUF6415 family natural product biosynthesis protein [Streptomyces cinnamoneus]PHQ50544.1 hypothetical protein BLA24_17150 [Streptomyces cinnamoneus]PPT14202.1 hypothetical protein CYQ11_16125 [Streptomyces cinnamoneus]
MTAPVHEHAFDEATVQAVIRRALDRLPLADTVDNLIAALCWHTERLLPAVETKDWSAHGQGELVTVIVDGVRKKLDARPASGAVAAARAVYAQEVARACRALLGLALVEPGDEERLRGGPQ